VGDDLNRIVRALAVGANNLALAVINADNAELGISRFGFKFSRKTLRDPFAPGLFGKAIDGIDTAREMGESTRSMPSRTGTRRRQPVHRARWIADPQQQAAHVSRCDRGRVAKSHVPGHDS